MEEYDVIIAGAGPAGLSAAVELSKHKDIKILLIEKRKKLGSDKIWTCWESELKPFGLDSIIANKSEKIVFRTYLGTTAEKDSDHCAINQDAFFKEMFSRIKKVNFNFLNNCRFISYEYDADKKIIIKTDRGNFKSKLLIDATGIESPVIKNKKIKFSEDYYYVYSKIFETDYIDRNKMVLLDVAFYNKYNPWFWVIPLSSKKFILGTYYFTNKDLPRNICENNIKNYIKQRNMKVRKTFKISVGRIHLSNFQRTYFDNIILVGESANQAVPANAYLFIKSLMFGKIAAEVAEDALKYNNLSSRFLKRYEQRWKREVALCYTFNQILGKVIKSLDNKEIDESFKIINKIDGQVIKRFEIGDLTRKDIILTLYHIFRHFKLNFLLNKFNQHKIFYLQKILKLVTLFF